MACAQDSRKLFDIFDNDTNLAQRPEENTHFDPLLPRFSPHGERRRRRQREVCTCTCIRWGLFPWSSAHVDGCIQLQRGLWIGNLALAPNGTSSPSRVKNTQEPRSPSPTLELLYEALSRLWHKDNCPPPSTHTHTSCTLSRPLRLATTNLKS